MLRSKLEAVNPVAPAEGDTGCTWEEEQNRVINDVIYITQSRLYLNEKKYLILVIDKLYKSGYYSTNESILGKVIEWI